MTPQVISAIAAAFSMKNEIKYIFVTFLVICLVPIFTVLVITQVGLDIVSDSLVTRNPQAITIDIRDPATGNIVDQIDALGIWPVSGPVSLEFGKFHLPYQPFHTGIDIATNDRKVGTPVVAFMKGKVTYADSVSWGYGKHVKIDHGHHVSSVYAHLHTLSVAEGDEVEIGQVIGMRGSTGWSTGPHLHFEIRVFGIPVNPRVFLDGEP